MPYEVARVPIWVTQVDDQPGALLDKLAALRTAGINLESAVIRPTAPLSGEVVLFIAPMEIELGATVLRDAGLRRCETVHAVRIAGPDRLGLLAEMTAVLDQAGLQVAGLTSVAIGDRSVHHLRLESAADADRALDVLRAELA